MSARGPTAGIPIQVLDVPVSNKLKRKNPKHPAKTFWERVQKSEGCWEWTGPINSKGYGNLHIGEVWSPDGKRRNVLAHRFSYTLHKGTIPQGLTLDHLCRNRACVNPDHLEPVTMRENVLRGDTMKRLTHCKHGHEFTDDNIKWEKMSTRKALKRLCLTCARRRGREHARKRAKEKLLSGS